MHSLLQELCVLCVRSFIVVLSAGYKHCASRQWAGVVGGHGWTPRAHQSHSITPLHSEGHGRENITKGSWVDEDGERLLSNYSYGQTRLDSGKLV